LRFGQFNKANEDVQRLAMLLGRAPSSVSMKLCNLASFDPALRSRGIKGLEGASQLDRQVWDEYHANLTASVQATEQKLRALITAKQAQDAKLEQPADCRSKAEADLLPLQERLDDLEQDTTNYFQAAILSNYEGRCAVSGLTSPDLLLATRILPRETHPELEMVISNGICLSALYHRSFLRGLISFDDQLRVMIASRLKQGLATVDFDRFFGHYDRQPMHIPPDGVLPAEQYLREHRRRLSITG
jgi:hypothetical protein